MNKFFSSKLFITIEHAVKVAVFISLSAFATELINSDFSKLLASHLPAIVTVGMINLVLVSAVKFFNLKKTAALTELANPVEEIKVEEKKEEGK